MSMSMYYDTLSILTIMCRVTKKRIRMNEYKQGEVMYSSL